jgi:hypothetical protein
MIKIYRHKKHYYDLESVDRFIDVEYVNSEEECDYVAVACSHNESVFEGIRKPIIYSYLREHPYEHDEYLQTQFKSLHTDQKIIIFSIGSFEKIAPGRKNIIIDNFELDCYHRLFVKKECGVVQSNFGTTRLLFLGGKADKNNRKPLLDALLRNEKTTGRLAWSMFGVDGGEPLDDIQTEDNHYLGYPYDSIVYQSTNFSVISETHFDQNQEFHPTEKTYRAIANRHPFAILSTPFFLKKLKDKGYVTFNRTLDENYDIETNPQRRLQKFVNSLNSLVEKNVNYKTFEKKCEQNVNTLIRNAKETKQRIIEGITNDRISNSGNAEVYDS